MSGYNRFTSLIVERNWDLLNSAIDEADEEKRRQMASESFYGDLPLHAALKLEAPTKSILKLIAAYPEAQSILDKNKKSSEELAYDHFADTQVVQILKKDFIKSSQRTSYTNIRVPLNRFTEKI